MLFEEDGLRVRGAEMKVVETRAGLAGFSHLKQP